MEASGTSNMKFAMNGGLILGTMDGANIEIREEIGSENMFIFGLLTEEIAEARQQMFSGEAPWPATFCKTIDLIKSGIFGDFPEQNELLNTITQRNDYYLIAADWDDYLKAHKTIDEVYKNKNKWTEMCILSVAGMGKFSSDRSIKQYADQLWNLKAHSRPGPLNVETSLMSGHGAKINSFETISTQSRIALERLSVKDQKLVESFSPSCSPANKPFGGLGNYFDIKK